MSPEFSSRHRFEHWPNIGIPHVAAGVYAIWDQDKLIYCGMAGREFDKSVSAGRIKVGLVNRLGAHANGRLSGNQFCVYVANRFVIPSLQPEQLPLFASGALNLDKLTKKYIHNRLEYQFAIAESAADAFRIERDCRNGTTFGAKPVLNPL